jgi:hypothetical protein
MTCKKVLGVVCLMSLLFTICVSAQQASVAEQPEAPPVRATASVLRLIRFSGSLSDSLGQPRSGAVGVTFALYAEQEGGAPLWLETQNVALDPQGHYTVLLGATESEGLPLEIFSSGEARWLGIQVQGQPEQPRVLLVAVPYALKAAEAETLSGKKASDFILSEQLSEQVQQEIETQVQERAESGEIPAGEEGIEPQAVNETGRSTFTDTNSTEVVFVEQSGTGYGLRATAPSNSGLRGETTDTTGTPAGVEGVAAANRGRGVYGHTTNTTGRNIGVLGESNSVDGTGVFGSALAATGNTTGVRGDVQSTTGVGVFGFARALTGTPVGVRGQTFSRNGIGVEGVASPAGGSAAGVKGESLSNLGRGVYGLASHSTGVVNGVLGETPSTKGRGVFGVATAATGPTVGVRGDTFSLDGTGVTGFARHASGGVGVFGLAISSSAVAGQFENSGGGKILSGVTSGKNEVFSVSGSGGTTIIDTGGIALSASTSSAGANATGVRGFNTAVSGSTIGVWGKVGSASGTAGLFDNTAGGKILSGRTTGNAEVFSVDGNGNVEADGDVKFGPSAGLFAPGGAENLRVVRGRVSSAAAVIDGSGFSATHPSTGTYNVNMSAGFNGTSSPVVIPVNSSPLIPIITGLSSPTGGFAVLFFDTSGTLTDTEFIFIAAGPR